MAFARPQPSLKFSRWRVWRALLFAVVVSGSAFAQTPTSLPPQKFNEQVGPCQEARVAAMGRELFVVAWTIASGPQRGVWLRWRNNFMTDPAPTRIADIESPRDLAVVFDTNSRLHLIWTAPSGADRRFLHTRIDRPGDPIPPAQLITPPSRLDSDGTVCLEFPSLAAADDGSVLVAWQQSRSVGYTIHALRIAAGGEIQPLGMVSGASQSGIYPQIVSTSPVRIAWKEVTLTSTEQRVNEWDESGQRWRPSLWELDARRFESRGRDLLLRRNAAGNGLIGCWQEPGPDGRAALIVGQPKPGVPEGPESLATSVFNQPAGEHAFPSLAATGTPRPTIAWRVFTAGRQAICIAPITPGASPVPMILTSPDQRFASIPDHATVGNWSAVAWVDNVRDGGNGNVFVSEVTW